MPRFPSIPHSLGLVAAAIFALLTQLVTAQAAQSEWTTPDGKSFQGEPSGILGPSLIFETGPGKGRRVLMRHLSQDAWKRFVSELPKGSGGGGAWALSTAPLLKQLRECALAKKGKVWVPADFSARSGPEVLVLFYASAADGASYSASHLFQAFYQRMKRLYGDRFEVIYFGIDHDDEGTFSLANTTGMPWLVADPKKQEKLSFFKRFRPAGKSRMVAVSREGVPLADAHMRSVQSAKQFIDECGALLFADDPTNRLFVEDLARFHSLARPQRNPKGELGPMLLSSPFNVGALQRAGITRLKARLSVDLTGRVTAADIDPESGIPEAHLGGLQTGFIKSCRFLPALRDGQPVEGSFDYEMKVPSEAAKVELDRAWLKLNGRKEVAVPNWLLLRPIPVEEASFSRVLYATEDGVTQMSAYRVSGSDKVSRKSQQNAFFSDFFGEDGAGTVAPVAGKKQEVDGQSYTWEAVESVGGFVDFKTETKIDYTIGYAYAEFDAPAAGAYIMGLGSDEGVKVWLNGVMVKNSWGGRACKIDEDLVPMNLVAGKNRLLIKIQNSHHEWSFFMRLRG